MRYYLLKLLMILLLCPACNVRLRILGRMRDPYICASMSWSRASPPHACVVLKPRLFASSHLQAAQLLQVVAEGAVRHAHEGAAANDDQQVKQRQLLGV